MNASLDTALRQFEATEANLSKLLGVWDKIQAAIPSGVAFFGADPNYQNLLRSYEQLLAGLPLIDGWKPEAVPMDLDVIASTRLDCLDLGEVNAEVGFEREIHRPFEELTDCQFRLRSKRRQACQGRCFPAP